MADPKKEKSNFLDNLPLISSEDSDRFVVSTENKLVKKEEKNNLRERSLKKSEDSKDSFEVLFQTDELSLETQSKLANEKRVDLRKNENENERSPEKKEMEEEKIACMAENSEIPTVKFEFKLEDSSIFTINVIAPKDKEENIYQTCRFEDQNKGLYLENDVVHDLKSYRPKVPTKKLPWIIFGAGIAAFAVFIIIIIKLRRALKR